MNYRTGDLVEVRDRLWKIRKTTATEGGILVAELESLDPDGSRELVIATPPDTLTPIPSDDIQ